MSRLWRRGLPGPTGRGPPWACRSVSGRVAGSRPGGRPHFLYGQEMGERSRRGLCPLDPRAASGWPSAKVGGARFTDERTGVQHPARRRATGAMPLPASLRNRIGSSHRGGTSAFAWRAAPAGRRKTARLRRARAQGARTPGTGVVFRRAVSPSLPGAVVGRTESAISKAAVQSDGRFFMRVDGKTASAPPLCRTGGAGGGAPRPACIKSFGGPGGTLQSSPW